MVGFLDNLRSLKEEVAEDNLVFVMGPVGSFLRLYYPADHTLWKYVCVL